MEKTYNVKSSFSIAWQLVWDRRNQKEPLFCYVRDPHLKEQCTYKLKCSTWVAPPSFPHTLKLALLRKHLSLLIETEMESNELIKVRKKYNIIR